MNHNVVEWDKEWEVVQYSIVDIQKKLVLAEENSHQTKQKANRNQEQLCLGIIDILDFVHRFQNDDTTGILGRVHKQLNNLLKTQGVTEIISEYVQAGMVKVMETKSQPDLPDGKILETIGKGYYLGEKVIRPIKVISNKI